jgi:hypothetical protein
MQYPGDGAAIVRVLHIARHVCIWAAAALLPQPMCHLYTSALRLQRRHVRTLSVPKGTTRVAFDRLRQRGVRALPQELLVSS